MQSLRKKAEHFHKETRKKDITRRLEFLREKTEADFRLADTFEDMDSPERLAEEYQEYLKRQTEAQQ